MNGVGFFFLKDRCDDQFQNCGYTSLFLVFLEWIDYFDEKKYNYFRKRVLDLGNETLREMDKNFEFLDLNVKNEKK